MSIPGLNVCSEEEEGRGIELQSFQGQIRIPYSHKYGNCRRLNEFEILGTIREGSFGEIEKCKDKRTDVLYCLKKPRSPAASQESRSSVLREANLLGVLKHNNIIHKYFVIADDKLENNYLLLDYCPFSLQYLIEKDVKAIYQKDVIKCIMKQLFEGLAYIHKATVVHRDINCENIVLTEKGVLKITGFHASRFYSKGDMTPNITELIYRAPELLFNSKKYSYAVDMWSTGCVFARLLLKRPLFVGNTPLEVLRSICDVLGIPSETVWPGFGELVLVSKRDETSKLIREGKPYNDLKYFFGNEPLSVQYIIKDLLLYCPEGRMTSQDCLKSTYLAEKPVACSLQIFSLILESTS